MGMCQELGPNKWCHTTKQLCSVVMNKIVDQSGLNKILKNILVKLNTNNLTVYVALIRNWFKLET